eukprot:GHUV01020427.1.p1 GENE.GHUV01020427.1~~GHUV01020427.1.p1  ORF type:complete len:382 (+),score=138.94 GHUV01020427.1:815-1960(+)
MTKHRCGCATHLVVIKSWQLSLHESIIMRGTAYVASRHQVSVTNQASCSTVAWHRAYTILAASEQVCARSMMLTYACVHLRCVVQAEWPSRLQSALESAETSDPAATAELLSELQAEVALELESLDEALGEYISDPDDRRLVLCGVYAAYDLAWQMEELLQDTPDLDRLTNCVALLRLFARGSESHVYSAMALDELYSARAQALSEEAARRKNKTLARQKQLTTQIQRLLAEAQTTAFANAEAITCRYGLLPEEGLVQQLQQGLTMFYAGLSALSAAKGEGSDAVPGMTRNLTIEGIPVTVVDTVEGSAFAGDEGTEVGRSGVAAAGQRVKVDWLEAAQGADEPGLDEAAALEAAAEQALAAAVAQIEAEGAAGQQLTATT